MLQITSNKIGFETTIISEERNNSQLTGQHTNPRNLANDSVIVRNLIDCQLLKKILMRFRHSQVAWTTRSRHFLININSIEMSASACGRKVESKVSLQTGTTVLSNKMVGHLRFPLNFPFVIAIWCCRQTEVGAIISKHFPSHEPPYQFIDYVV